MQLRRCTDFLVVLYLINVSKLQNVSGVDPPRDHYTAAVVEYYRTIEYDQEKINAEATLNKNTEYYLGILKNVQDKITEDGKPPLDIIVYPESTLYAGFTNIDYLQFGTLVPAATDENAPCDDIVDKYRPFLRALSCGARLGSTYMVVNVLEQEPCTEQQVQDQSCSDHGFNLYNTNVAFDRLGTVVAKYRKYNLFKEPLNQTDYAEKVTFETDFGVTFGTFTCFDIMFQNPTLELVERGIKHFIFPSMWFSELPFLVSVQAHEMWARENEVVLLASGALNPDVGSGGSGIYQGSHGSLENILTAEKANQHVIIQEVPKEWNPKPEIVDPIKAAPNAPSVPLSNIEEIISLDNFKLIWDNNTEYTSQLLNQDLTDHSYTVCSTASGFENGELPEGEPERFCCEFIILTETNVTPFRTQSNFYQYRLFAYSGVRSFTGAYNGGLEVCAIVACTNGDDQTSCGKRFPDAGNIIWPLTFNDVIIQANYTKSPQRAQFPNSLKWNLKSIPAIETSWETVDYDTQVHRTHKTLTSQSQMLTFGIYGRDFARDSDPHNAASYISQQFITLVIVFAVVLLSVVFNFH